MLSRSVLMISLLTLLFTPLFGVTATTTVVSNQYNTSKSKVACFVSKDSKLHVSDRVIVSGLDASNNRGDAGVKISTGEYQLDNDANVYVAYSSFIVIRNGFYTNLNNPLYKGIVTNSIDAQIDVTIGHKAVNDPLVNLPVFYFNTNYPYHPSYYILCGKSSGLVNTKSFDLYVFYTELERQSIVHNYDHRLAKLTNSSDVLCINVTHFIASTFSLPPPSFIS